MSWPRKLWEVLFLSTAAEMGYRRVVTKKLASKRDTDRQLTVTELKAALESPDVSPGDPILVWGDGHWFPADYVEVEKDEDGGIVYIA